MPQLKHFERAGAVTIAFCPEWTPGQLPPLMAAGTVAGAVDMNFSTSSQLELIAVDLASSADTLPVVGTVQAPERFNRIAWGQRISTDASFPPMGLLAGGLADGSVCLWDPAIIAARTEGRQPLLAKMQKHTGAVRGLEFNPFSHNLLASGAADSDLCIWDLAKPSTPSLYPGVKGTSTPGGGPGADIMHICWNRKVQHILASCTSAGSTVVWDLKRQKPVISFKDPNSQRRASVLQWNPEVATQLVVASDDDRSPTLQMWDLRNSVSPLKEFVAHSKGVLGMAWCPDDPSLLLSCGKDHRNICWDVTTADIMCELPASTAWNFDIQWAPAARGVFATACFDGKVGLHNLHECTGARVVETLNTEDWSVSRSTTGDATPLKHVPVWMKRPCGATFGFGGKLVSFTNNKVNGVDASGQAVQRDQALVSTYQVITESELVSRSEEFEQAIAGGDKQSLQAYCDAKAAQATEVEEAESWAFLGLLFDDRERVLKQLGFGDLLPKKPDPQEGQYANGDGQAGDALSGRNSHVLAGDGLTADGELQLGEDIQRALDAGNDESAVETCVKAQGLADAQEMEDDIQRALFAGNYESAVETCFKAHRLADALLIANIGSSDLFMRTMHRYMKLCPKPYMALMKAHIDHDYEALVRTRPVGQWRDTLALLAAYTSQEDWPKQCDLLASRLAAAGMHHAALLCHICAGNVDAAVAFWARSVSASTQQVDKLQLVIEKSVIMSRATASSKASGSLSDLVTSYASLLAAQGKLSTALEYLEYAPGEASTAVAVLKDRIYRSGAVAVAAHRFAPQFPFVLEDVRASAVPAQASYTTTTQSAAAAGGGYGGWGAAQHTQPAATAAATSAYATYASQPTNAYGAAAPAAAPKTTAGPYQQQSTYGYNTTTPAAPATTNNTWGATATTATAANTAGAGGWGAGGGYGATAAPPTQPPPASAYNAYNQPSAAQQQQHQTSAASAYYQQTPAASAYSTNPYGGYGTTAQQPAAPAQPQYTTQQQTSAFDPTTTTAGAELASHLSHTHISQQQQSHHQPQQTAYNTAPPPTSAAAHHQAPGQMHMDQSWAGQGQVYMPKRPSAGPPPASTPASNVYTAGAQHGAGGAAAPISTTNAFAPTTTQAAAAAPQAYFMPTTTNAAPGAGAAAQGMYGAAPGGAPPPGAPGGLPSKPSAPPPPPGPPANISVQTADVSQVPADLKPVVASLTGLFNSCMALANTPAKKREMEDNSRKMGQLLWRLNQGDVSEGVVPKLHQLARAVDGGDWAAATAIQVGMTTSDWEECGFWLSAIKRLIKMRQMGV